MNHSLSVRTGVLAGGFLIATASLGTVSATTMRANPQLRIPAGATHAARSSSTRGRSAATTCPGTGSPAFVGYGGANQATVNYSGVAAGDSDSACQPDSFVGGGYQNLIGGDSSSVSGFIGGGNANTIQGTENVIGGGYDNQTDSNYSFVGSGNGNLVNGDYSGVVAGYSNNPAGVYSFVGAGLSNSVTGNGSATAGGGYIYIVGGGNQGKTQSTVSGEDSFLGAGDQDKITGNQDAIGAGSGNTLNGSDSFIGSGANNTLSGNDAVIGGGISNTVGPNGTAAAILGGTENEVLGQYGAAFGGFGNNSSGEYSIVAGGDANESLGTLSFAAGYHAHATKNGSFVWADYSSGKTLADSAANQFVTRATGGYYLYSNSAATTGVYLAAGSGAWASLSDRNSKTNIVPLDDDSVLSKVAALPVSAWSYTSEHGVRHVGPMAQDFYAAFGTGPDSRHITSIDEDGVALSAIKALDHQNVALRTRLATVETRNATLEHRLDAMAAKLGL